MSNSCYLSCNLPFVNSTKGAQTILSYGLRITLFVLGVLAAASGIYVLAGLSHTSIVGYSLLAGGACTAFLSSILKCVRPEVKIEEPPLLVEVPATPIIPFKRVDALPPELWGIIFGELENDDALLSVARLCQSHAEIVKRDQNLSRRLLSYQLREQALEIWKEKLIVDQNYDDFFKNSPHLVQQHLPRLIEILEHFLRNLQRPKKGALPEKLYWGALPEKLYWNIHGLFLILPLENHPKKTIFLEQAIKSAKSDEYLCACVQFLVKYDLERAKEIAESMKPNTYFRDFAWGNIALHQAAYDFSQAITSLNQIISITQKKWHLGRVIEIAYQNKTQNLPEMLEALWEECRAQNNLNIYLSVKFALAFRTIKNNQKVFEILDSFTTWGLKWEWERGNLISNMAQQADCTDVDDMAFLEGLYKRAMNHANKRNLAVFAVVFARIDAKRGQALLDEIERFIKQSSCWNYFTSLALCYRHFDIEKAIQLINEHPQIKAKISGLIQLANHLRLHDPKLAVSLLEQAYDHALKENMEVDVFQLICTIAQAYVHLNRERASEILIGLDPWLNQFIESLGFAAYLKTCTQIDINKAFSLIIPIQEPIMKARGYMTMAKVIDESGFNLG